MIIEVDYILHPRIRGLQSKLRLTFEVLFFLFLFFFFFIILAHLFLNKECDPF